MFLWISELATCGYTAYEAYCADDLLLRRCDDLKAAAKARARAVADCGSGPLIFGAPSLHSLMV